MILYYTNSRNHCLYYSIHLAENSCKYPSYGREHACIEHHISDLKKEYTHDVSPQGIAEHLVVMEMQFLTDEQKRLIASGASKGRPSLEQRI